MNFPIIYNLLLSHNFIPFLQLKPPILNYPIDSQKKQSYTKCFQLRAEFKLKLMSQIIIFMINIPICLSVIVISILLPHHTAAYRITTGGSTIAAAEIDFITKGKTAAPFNITSFYKFFIFPYDVFQYHANDSINLIYTRNFIFLKNNFSYIEPFMDTQNSTLDLQDEIEILYSRIPEVIHIIGENGQQLEIDLIDTNIECRQFVIKNSSLDKIQNGVKVYDLNFYYMQINKYLLKVMTVAYIKSSENSTAAWFQEYQQTIFQTSNGKSLQEYKKHKFVVQNILTNQTFWQGQDFSNFLIYRVFTRRIKEGTKWRALYDGFTIKYFSVHIQKAKADSTASEPQIQLTRFQVTEGQIKQSKVIKEPLKYVKMLQIQFLDMCRQGEKISVIFGDKNLTYVVDITKDEWHLLFQIKMGLNNSNLIFPFFGKDCNVYGLLRKPFDQKNQTQKESSQIQQYYPQKSNFPQKQNRKKVEKAISHYFKPSVNYLIVCDTTNNCSILQTKSFKEVNNLFDIKEELIITKQESVNYRVAILENQVKYLFEIMNPKQKQQRMVEGISNDTINAQMPVAFLHPIYSSLIYRNKTKYISNEMNRQIYQHIKESVFLQNKQKELYFDQIFYQKGLQQNCLVPFEFESTVAEVKFNQSKNWVVCIWQHQINQYTQLILNFKEKLLDYQLYLCASFLELYSDRMNIQCVTLLDQIDKSLQTKTMSLIEPLRSNHFYKLYIVKHKEVKQKNLPTIFVKDVERQQIQVASTIFFIIMIVLSLLLLGLVLFITLKSVVINLLVYYGFVDERVEPTYPLAWFPLKTKLKRLQQHGILKFVEYEPSVSDTQGNHCCFCLQLIKNRTIVAQIYCGHQFHKQCFKQWIKNEPNAKCPTCRRHFTRTALVEYQNNIPSQQDFPI